MTIFIGADHRGFELKDKIEEYLREKNVRVEDMGAYELDPQDDFTDFAKKVAQAVAQKPNELLGIVICGSGSGVSVVCNKFKGVWCSTAVNKDEVQHVRERDHVNVLAIGSDYMNFDQAKMMVDIFLETAPTQEPKYLRRVKKIAEIEKENFK